MMKNMAGHYEESRCLFSSGLADLAYLTDAELAGFDYIHGHFGYRLFRRLNLPHRKVTTLRHPVDRVVSLYHYHRSVDEPQQMAWLTKRLTLEEFIDSDHAVIRANVDNGQTWQLFHDIPPFCRAQYRHWRGRDILAQAKENLAGFDVVCIQEHFAESLDTLEERLGLPLNRRARANVNAHRPRLTDVPQRILDKIADRNPLDMELYETAVVRLRSLTARALQPSFA